MADGQLRYSIFITADATQAKAAAAAVEAALEGVSAETREGAAAATHYSGAIEASAAKARAAAVAVQGAGVQMRQVGAASALSAGQVGNLTAQFNDIGMMLMAGQNPLQLAIQQGTQITQVIGPMGASGAVRALGSAFMGMLNPVNLVTIGSIAAGAAMVQWLSGINEADDAALEATERFEDLSAVIDGLRDVSQASSADIDTYLRTTFTVLADDVQSLIDDLRDAEFSVISRGMRQAVEAGTADLTRLAGAFDVFTAELMNPGSVESGYLAQVNEIIAAAQMSLPAFDQLQAKVQAVFAAQNVDEFIGALADARAEAQAIGGPVGDNVAAAMLKAAEDAGVLNRVLGEASGKMGGLTNEAARLADQMQRAVAAAIELSAQGATDLARAQIGYEFRDDPVGRARALARAEFDSRTETLAGADSTIANIVEQERREYVAAAGAAEEYRQKTIAARKAAADALKGAGGSRGPELGLVDAERLYNETRSAAEKYAAEVERINALHARFPDIVTDDVQARALDRLKEKYTELGKAGIDAAGALRSAFDGIFDDPQRALETLAQELVRMAAYQQLATSFPTMFGASGLIPLIGRAEGGPISGPGTSTSDSILMWASDGEYMVNAASTARYRPLLEAINADQTGRLLEGLPKRAAGGIITSSAVMPQARAMAAAPSAAAAPAPVVLVENYGAEPATAERRTGPNGEEMVAVIVGKQWARGRFDRSARARHGVKPEPVWR